MPKEFSSQTLEDSLFAFEAGMNQGVAPLLLPKNQLANLVNGTVRGTFATHRPSFQKRTMIWMDTGIQLAFEGGLWQGACYYKSDSGQASLVASVSGKLWHFEIVGNQVHVFLRSSAATQQSDSAPKCWLWQSEKWTIWNDGISNPVFFDGTSCVRSNYNISVNLATDTTATFIVPKIASTVTVNVTSTANLNVGDLVMIKTAGHFLVQSMIGLAVVFVNVDSTFGGQTISTNSPVWWKHLGLQLPPGRMGAYGMGRNWVSLVDGKQFVASDLVGGSSGTQVQSFRDSVLSITENIYLAGGGNFTVPGSIGDIKVMKFVATLDSSQGQGPLQVLTSKTVFSCNAPVDRLTWQDITYPILSESLISNGALSQNSTVNANGDLIFRSNDGIRSELLARQQFSQWGNVPQSREVQTILDRDNPSLLSYGSAVVFNNRLIMTTGPVQHVQGVYHKGMVVMNFDPVSSLRGKAPSIYDGLWTAMQPLQFVLGDFQEVERCFAFTLNTVENKIELWEVMRDVAAHYDETDTRITWAFESPVIFNRDVNRGHDFLQLEDGEIYIDEMRGTVDFQVYYKPDQWPCFVPWHEWQQCALEPVSTDPNTANYKPGFNPRVGIGTPRLGIHADDGTWDTFNNRPLRNGYSFQIKIVITGSCRFLGARFRAFTVPQPAFAKMICNPVCP